MNATEEMHFIETFDKVEAVVARVAAVREAAGSEFGIAVDFHGRVHKPMAKVLARELEPYHLMFIEEPVLPENNEALREIAAHTSTPIATGERMYSRWDFKPLLQDGYVDILQPDVSHAGGISEVVKIAAMAEAYDVALAPHCPLGPIALASCLQVDAVAHNALDSGAEPRHSLQSGQRSARLSGRSGGVCLRGRLRHAADCARVWGSRSTRRRCAKRRRSGITGATRSGGWRMAAPPSGKVCSRR